MSKFHVDSEVGQLKQVLLHRPELSIKRLTPSNYEELLFDGVLWVDKAREEHDVFAQTLRNNGVEVHYLEKLLGETLEVPEARQMVFDRAITPRRHGTVFADALFEYLSSLSAKELATHLIGGLTRAEFKFAEEGLLAQTLRPRDFVLPPLPNHLYTRDTSCWIYNGVSLNPMALPPRQRETIHLSAIYHYHPMFAKENFNWWYGLEAPTTLQATIEGGDVLVIGKKAVLIGMGERTLPQAVETLALHLFERGEVEHIVAVRMPPARAFMHLDTIMTMVDIDAFCVFPRLEEMVSAWSITPKANGKMTVTKKDSLRAAIAEALQLKTLNFIHMTEDEATAEREQWEDGNNLLAVKPGTVIGYDRNTEMNRILRREGINVLEIPGSELGRGRGGPRCMSCPLERDGI